MKKCIYLILIVFNLNATDQTLKDCSTCLVQIMQPEQIENLSIDEIQYLANDLIARKGYNFKRGDIDFYYSQNVTDLLPQRKTTRNTTPTQTVVLLMCFM